MYLDVMLAIEGISVKHVSMNIIRHCICSRLTQHDYTHMGWFKNYNKPYKIISRKRSAYCLLFHQLVQKAYSTKTALGNANTHVPDVILWVVCVTLDVSLAGWATPAIKVLLIIFLLIIVIARYMHTLYQYYLQVMNCWSRKSQNWAFFKRFVCQLQNM